jgi:hypothetical protein
MEEDKAAQIGDESKHGTAIGGITLASALL